MVLIATAAVTYVRSVPTWLRAWAPLLLLLFLYSEMPAIIAAAEVTDAEAIHPGYGFLSENADFAERVEKSGFQFIGPTPESIRIMGDKVSAKQAMIKAGVPCVPGSEGELPDDPVMIRGGWRVDRDDLYAQADATPAEKRTEKQSAKQPGLPGMPQGKPAGVRCVQLTVFAELSTPGAGQHQAFEGNVDHARAFRQYLTQRGK